MPKRSKRYEFFEELEVNKDTYLDEMPAIGLLTTGGPQDPHPSIRIKDGRIVEMDEKPVEEFDLIDHFIARYSIDITMAESAMAIDSAEFAKMIVDINVPRSDIVKYAAGMTPAKIVAVVTKGFAKQGESEHVVQDKSGTELELMFSHLEDEETRKIAPIAISLTGNRSVVVIKTPRGAIKERKIPVAN